MEQVEQIFNPPLHLCLSSHDNVLEISKRLWNCDENHPICEQQVQKMGYIGQAQIEEVWKHYYQEYYISNLGYVVKIRDEDKEKASTIIPEELKKADENSQGVRWKDFSNELKDLFRDNAFVPLNRKNSGCQICLNITGNSDQYDLHKLVARFFLKKPQAYENEPCVVHHIDNNSFNNSVTNLIWLKRETHQGNNHQLYHPMSK